MEETVLESEEQSDSYSDVDIEALLVEKVQDILIGMPKQYESDLVQLGFNHHIIEATKGDLNGDDREDIAVVVEQAPIGEHGGRTTYILMNEPDGYKVKHKNEGLIMSADSGGTFGDPFDGISIVDGILTISNYGGSSDRWGYSYSFSYADGGLRLVKTETNYHSTHTADGVTTICDYLKRTVETYSSCGGDESLTGLLLYAGTFTQPESYFEAPIFDESSKLDGTPHAPQMGYYEYQGYQDVSASELPLKPNYSANQALELIVQSYYPYLEVRQISWTEETKENYKKLLHYEMPDFYYENEDGRLSYLWIEVQTNEGRVIGTKHVLEWNAYDSTYEHEEDYRFYYVDGESGEITST